MVIMTAKSTINNIKKEKNDTNFLDEIRKAFKNKPYLRRRDLINELTSTHSNKVGYNRVTLGRKIKQLCNDNVLVTLYYDDFKKYGIKETDRKASYLIFKETTEVKKHMDRVFKLVESNDLKDLGLVLRELDNYRNRYVLDGMQLDKLVEKLEVVKDNKFRYNVLMLLFNTINRGIKPTDEERLLEIFRAMLIEYPLESYKEHGIRSLVVELLGYYSDNIVIKQLIKDAKQVNDNYSNEAYSFLSSTYCSEAMAKLIESNRTKLFKVEKDFAKEGKTYSAALISRIRESAIRNLDTFEFQKRAAWLRMSWSPSALK